MKVVTRVDALVAKFGTRNPFSICEMLDVHVVLLPLKEMRGFYLRIDGVDIIFIADDLPEWSCMFVCAHELGHQQIHCGMNRIFHDRRTLEFPNRYESEADKFACRLLYSAPPLFMENELLDWQIAECLNVPVRNVLQRLHELGIYL